MMLRRKKIDKNADNFHKISITGCLALNFFSFRFVNFVSFRFRIFSVSFFYQALLFFFRFVSQIFSFRFVLFRFVSFRFVSFRFVSFRFVSFRFVSFRFVSFRFVSFQNFFRFLFFIKLCYVLQVTSNINYNPVLRSCSFSYNSF
jgi:hypothetical protein